MAYVISGHALLSSEAAALGSPQLAAEQQVAELLLGLRDTEYLDAAKLDAENALAMQVSLQAAADPMTFLARDETEGIQKVTWREGVPIHPLALAIVTALAATALPDPGLVLPRQSAAVPITFAW